MSSLTISGRSERQLFLISVKSFSLNIIKVVSGRVMWVFNEKNLTCVNFPFCMLKLSIESFRFAKLLSFSACMFELENWICLIWITFDDDENKSFASMVTVRSKSYIDSDWMGAWIFCKLLRNTALVMPGHSRNNPVK